jgi:hypothetical protein
LRERHRARRADAMRINRMTLTSRTDGSAA